MLEVLVPRQPEGVNLTIGALVASMADSSPQLTEVLARLGDMMHSMSLKLDEILHRFSPSSPSSASPNPTPHHQPPVPASTHKMKLEVSRFDGTEPLGWIFKINQYF